MLTQVAAAKETTLAEYFSILLTLSIDIVVLL